MCSIVGYVGKLQSRATVFEALLRLEYRGYDSAGFACIDATDNHLRFCKSEGHVQNLIDKCDTLPIDGYVSIGHTRWATHGRATEMNAHPQLDCLNAIAVVHNGIVENHAVLKAELIHDGHIFRSETDTEVIAHLLESLLIKHGDLKSAIVVLMNMVKGACSFVAIIKDYPDQLVVVRQRSPLCIGVGNDEVFVASDLLAFVDKTKNLFFLQDDTFALVRHDMVEYYDCAGNIKPILLHQIDYDPYDKVAGAYQHLMLKELHEQKDAIRLTVEALVASTDQIWSNLNLTDKYIHDVKRLSLIGCGSSWHAARIGQFFFESVANIATKVALASEMRYMPLFTESNILHIALSQSGETADILETVGMINALKEPIIAVTNVASCTLAREVRGVLLTRAGPERAVASTKAFSTQLALMYWFAHRIAYERKNISFHTMQSAYADLLEVAELLDMSIKHYTPVIQQRLAAKYAQYDRSIFLGRHISYPFALEAALKLKEISYIFSQCYPAGELKHGPLALVDEHIPVFIFSCQDSVIYQKLVSNAQEVKTRGGHLVVFAFEGQNELISLAETAFIFPRVKPLLEPLVMVGVMQYFAYEIANTLGRAIDKPRNLAKSVTVE